MATQKTVSVDTLVQMRTWFARHGPDASNGGTSYQGYLKFLKTGEVGKGAVAWELWGGDGAYMWLKDKRIRKAMLDAFPKNKQASTAVNLPKYNQALCKLFSTNQQQMGTVLFEADGRHCVVQCDLKGASPGQHGLHIHKCAPSEIGDCQSACAHYNPDKKQHGGATGENRHRGDLGNCEFGTSRKCKSVIKADVMLHEVLGRSVILHAEADDLGKGLGSRKQESLKTGNAGKRIACGVILLQ